ncbi:Spore protein SP21 [invertebrate metagenome]|uniref:Spore protein SP21 n=1 Tax=invertebrate metagenome TaxID=1711999 RepID=A0A2H9T9T3_9ZZZZ
MTLSVWDPFRDMEVLLDKYGRSSRKTSALSDERTMEVGDWTPTVDILETPDVFTIKAELPGVDKKDVTITVENNVLTLKGEKQQKIEDKKRHRIECSYGNFIRSFTLPQAVDIQKIKAKYTDGVLCLTLPKDEKVLPKQINVDVQ